MLSKLTLIWRFMIDFFIHFIDPRRETARVSYLTYPSYLEAVDCQGAVAGDQLHLQSQFFGQN